MIARKTIRAAAVQIAPVMEDRKATTDKVCAYIQEAGENGAEIVVFPETFIPNYPYFSFVKPPVLAGKDHLTLYDQAVEIPSPTTDQVGSMAKKWGIVVVLGVNERSHGTLYNAQIVFDATGDIVLVRRKITPTYHERMIWGQGDGSGLKAVDTAVGRVGALACWEHYNPLARYALMVDHEEIHCSQFPGSMVGPIFGDQIEVTIRHHALESGCFVINSTGWLFEEQIQAITDDPKLHKALKDGCMTAIISPEGVHLTKPLTEGEGIIYAYLDMKLIDKRKRMMDSVGHYARPELLSLHINNAEQKPAVYTSPLTKTETKEDVKSYDRNKEQLIV
uniref:Nitrilase n=1 Tax=uncultured organism TaxID=155900 RepID=Q6RWJ4_9ZZZZ|nr:nitrilase [uncultured organism]